MMTALLDHLWQSTLIACCAGLLTLIFRNNAAQIRYWLWFTASVKFLIPFSLLTTLGGHLIKPPALVIAPSTVDTVEQVAQPFSFSPAPMSATSTLAISAGAHLNLTTILLVVWAVGFAALLILWLNRWSQIKAALRSATPVSLTTRRPVPVKSSASVLEPGLVGIWRPVLLLPKGIETRLSVSEMDAIFAHELCHLRRRDNLTAAIHMVVEAVFWFHPLVWWLGAKLIAERERACDESVLTSGGDPQIYAESILKVCRFYVQSPLACAAGVSGADLKKRVEEIMNNRASIRMNAAKKALLAIAAALAIASPLVAGIAIAPEAAAQQKAAAVQITGRWAGDSTNPTNGVVNHVVLDLNADGGKLTGTLSEGGYPPIEIQDATVSGTKVSFTMARPSGQYGVVTVQNSGEIKGDDLTLDRAVVGRPPGSPGPLPLALKRVAPGSALDNLPPAAELLVIAQRWTEQQRPRTAIALDPKQFDTFVGRYQLGPTVFFTISRKDDHFFSQLTGQSEVEIFPESPTKFFLKVVPAQISFNTDAQDAVSGLVVHQNGREMSAPRITEAAFNDQQGKSKERTAAGKPDPEREALLRREIAAEQKGEPDPEIEIPALLTETKLQWPSIQASNKRLGKFTTLKFMYVDQRGWDVYNATYEHGSMICRVGMVTVDHKLEGLIEEP